ncbi:MAG: hypothetical protein KC620_02470 [Myxococcales bacterium]|nr:hypothetical protein [Myxococcales bacterium]
MDAEFNPYAPPSATADIEGVGGGSADGTYWFEGDRLVVPIGGRVPTDRCIFDGTQDGLETKTRKLQWMPPWLGIMVIISPLIFIILWLILRKTGSIECALGANFRDRRKKGILYGWGGALLALVLFVVGIPANMPVLTIVGLLLLVAAIITGAVMVQPFNVAKIDKQNIYIKLRPAALDAFRR